MLAMPLFSAQRRCCNKGLTDLSSFRPVIEGAASARFFDEATSASLRYCKIPIAQPDPNWHRNLKETINLRNLVDTIVRGIERLDQFQAAQHH